MFLLLASRLPAATTRTKCVGQLGDREDALAVKPRAIFLRYAGQQTKLLPFPCLCTAPSLELALAAMSVQHKVQRRIYAQIYFPTYSNGLKEITGYLAFRWSGSLTSGLETIVWRHRWEASSDPAMKQTLLDYNRQDCEALTWGATGNGLLARHLSCFLGISV